MKNSDINSFSSAAPGSDCQLARQKRFALRDAFLRDGIDPGGLLQAFEHIPGVLYFVKDAQSRHITGSAEIARRLGFEDPEEMVGRAAHEYLPVDLADKYLADDQWVIQNGLPILNVVEMGFNEQGMRDWIVTNKYPLRNRLGEVVGLVGTIQSFAERRQMLAHMGPVGRAVDFIRERLGEPLLLAEVAAHTGLSERQLQRHFRRVFGTSLQQFIIRSRIHAAIQELIRSEHSIAEIAIRFGFSDQSAFSNQFRRVIGMPPKQYRERYVARLATGR